MDKIILESTITPSLKDLIVEGCEIRWADSRIFLDTLLDKTEIVSVARENGDIAGFSIANYIKQDDAIGLNYLATRVSATHRKKGLAGLLTRRILKRTILTKKILSIKNWFKPFYVVTITANPIMYATLNNNLKIVPKLNQTLPNVLEMKLAKNFADCLGYAGKFDSKKFILSGFFLHSAECYENEIPWSSNAEINAFLEDRLNLKGKLGNGLILVSRIL